jgi:CBS domain-containing protein
MYGAEYIRATVAEDKKVFHELLPSDSDVACEHVFVYGNPSPEIVNAAKSCDLVVMSTHGRSGILRMLMGSVAQYVMRHATCPVISYRNSKVAKETEKQERQPQHFVTDVMHQVQPIHGFEEMDKVIMELNRANETAAPVVNEMGVCTGILTNSDIAKYRELQERFEKRDETVVDEIFETDEFGQRRAGNCDFNQVHRHMTSPVVTISNKEPCQKAQELFDQHKEIHHLVVIDERDHPVGILETRDLAECKTESSEA